MSEVTKQQAWGRDALMATAAVRYCIGRRTYITSDCADWLCDVWDSLPENARRIIKRDIEEAFERDDADRSEGSQYKALGDDCDRKSWERVKALWIKEGAQQG